MNDEELKLRRETLKILLKNFDDNRAIYECADEWVSKFKTTSGVIKYYKTYFAKQEYVILLKMVDKKVEEKPKSEEKPKGLIGKLKEAADDKEEQIAILSTFVRLAVLVWSAGILTLAYVKLPEALKIPEQKLDPTFIASVFTGVLATFGVQAGGKKKNGADGGSANISKKDMEFLIAKASETAPAQTIRIEQAPVTIVPNAAPPKK